MSSPFDFNPFTEIYKRLMAISQDALTSRGLANVRSFVDLTDNVPSWDEHPTTADLPAVWLLQTDFNFAPFDSSAPATNNRDVVFTQQFPLAVELEDMRVVPVNDCKLALMVGLTKAGRGLGATAPQQGQFVDLFRLQSGQDLQLQPERRTLRSIMTIEVQFRLPKTYMTNL